MGARDAASAAPKDGRYVVDRPVESPVRVVVVNEGMARSATSGAAVRTTTRRADSNNPIFCDVARRID
jgi:hypothetical protein